MVNDAAATGVAILGAALVLAAVRIRQQRDNEDLFDAWFSARDLLDATTSLSSPPAASPYSTASLRAAAWNLCLVGADGTISPRFVDVGPGCGARLQWLRQYNPQLEAKGISVAGLCAMEKKGNAMQSWDAVATWYGVGLAAAEDERAARLVAIHGLLKPGGRFFGEFLVCKGQTRWQDVYESRDALKAAMMKAGFVDLVLLQLPESWSNAVRQASPQAMGPRAAWIRTLVVQDKVSGVRVFGRRRGGEASYKAPQTRLFDKDGAYLRAGCLCVRKESASNGLQVLLVRRRSKENGKWSLPGGGQEHGEAPGDTAKREAFEEAGVEGTLGPCLGSFANTSKKSSSKKTLTTAFVIFESRFVDDGLWPESLLRERKWVSFDPDAVTTLLDKAHDMEIVREGARQLGAGAVVSASSD